MDLNPILLVLLGVGISMTLYRSTVLYPVKYNRGWVMVCLFVALLTGITLIFNPDYAGLTGFALWTILVIIPSLTTRLGLTLAARGRFQPALRLTQIARLLHPADNLLSMPDLIRMQACEQSGDIEGTIRLLEGYRDHPLRGIYANTQIFRLRGQYPELLAWLENNVSADHYRRDPSLLQFYLLALGNTGKLNEMIALFMQFRAVIERVPEQLLYNDLLIFTYCGRPVLVRQLLAGQYHIMPEPSKALWMAIAEITAGNVETGTETLQKLAESKDGSIRTAAQRRLKVPTFVADEILTPESRQRLAEIERDFAQHQRYQVRSAERPVRLIVTGSLIAVNVLMWLLEIQQGGDTDVQTLYQMGALYVPAVTLGGEWWRLVAALFLHVGVLHLGFNMLALYVLGRFTERMLGHVRQLIVYFAAGLGSMLILVALTEAHFLTMQGITVGASGAIMGLVGATAAIYLYDWRREASRMARRGLGNALMIVALQTLLDILIPQTSFAGHFGGLIIGFLVGLPLVALMRRKKATQSS